MAELIIAYSYFFRRSFAHCRMKLFSLLLTVSIFVFMKGNVIIYINPDAIYDQKQRAFWMSLGLDSNLEIVLSPLVHRVYGMRFHMKDSTSCQAFKKCLKTHLFRLAH